MPQASSQQPKVRRSGYAHLTLAPLNNLIIILPLLVFFQIGAACYGTDLVLLAPQYLRGVLRFFGVTGNYLPALSIAAILFIQHLVHKDPWEIHPPVIAGMIGESILWTIPLIAVSYLTGRLVSGSLSNQTETLIRQALIAVGAGVYEEFIFRMVLISLLMLLLVDVFALRKDVMTVLAVLVAAVLFGLCHFKVLSGAEDFAAGKFVFLATAGVLWGCLFIFRGFAIAVGAHIVWDLFVMVASPA